MATVYTTTGAVQSNPTAKTLLKTVKKTPESEILFDDITLAGALAANDIIGIRKIVADSVVLPLYTKYLATGTVSALTVDIGFYAVNEDGSIGAALATGDELLGGVDIGTGSVVEGTVRPVTVPDAGDGINKEVWIGVKVISQTASAAADIIDFYTAVNFGN